MKKCHFVNKINGNYVFPLFLFSIERIVRGSKTHNYCFRLRVHFLLSGSFHDAMLSRIRNSQQEQRKERKRTEIKMQKKNQQNVRELKLKSTIPMASFRMANTLFLRLCSIFGSNFDVFVLYVHMQ